MYDEVTGKVLASLENEVPWCRSWHQGLPRNYITGKVYQGKNYLNLCLDDKPSEFYLTYLQCKAQKGLVHKGAKGKSILFWKINEIENGDDVKKVPFLRLSNDFNICDTNLYNINESTPHTNISCEKVINNMPAKPVIKYNFKRCFYSPTKDYISTLKMNDFDYHAEFYSSLYHECIHATQHSSRLGRCNDSTVDTVMEELIAEIGSSYLCAYASIELNVIGITNSTSLKLLIKPSQLWNLFWEHRDK